MPPILALFRGKVKGLSSITRYHYYKMLGLNIKKSSSIGSISCEWPHKLTIGENCTVQDKVDFRIAHPFSEENYISIGDRVFIGRCSEINCSSRVIIGNDCLIASNTTIVDIGHQINPSTKINTQQFTSDEIVIGDDVWIGTRCIILKGITIGTGSVVAAGSIVNKSIPAFEVWGGSPARFIRKRN